jgi:hypothetical protein
MMADAPGIGANLDLPATDNFSHLYLETNWIQQHVDSQRVLQEFDIPTKGVVRTGQQLYEDIKATGNEMPHVYSTVWPMQHVPGLI